MPNGQAPRTAIQTAIEDTILQRFAFLVTERGFTPPTIDRQNYWTHVYYLSDRVGVEIELEVNYEYHAQVNLIRTEHGRLLADWDKMAVSQRWRYPVNWLFRDVCQVPAATLSNLKTLYDNLDPQQPATYDAYLKAEATLLRPTITLLMTLPYDTLFPF
jgi:hypothetical protein